MRTASLRASATSRFTPPVGIPAARADSNTPKTDEASPFALLVDAAMPSAGKSSNTSAGQKGGQNDDKSDDTPDTAKTATKTKDQTAAGQNSSAPSQGPSQPQSTAPSSGGSQQACANDNGAEDEEIAADQPDAPNAQQDQLAITAAAPATPAADKSDADPEGETDENGVALWPQSARVAAPAGQNSKSAKTEKGEKSDAKDQAVKPDDAPAPTPQQGMPDPQLVVAAVPPPQVPVPAKIEIDAETDIAGTSAIPSVAQPDPSLPAPQAADPSQPPVSQQPDQSKTQPPNPNAAPAADQTVSAPATPAAPQATSPKPAEMAVAAGMPLSQSQPVAPPQDQPVQNQAAAPAAPVKDPVEPVVSKPDAGTKPVKPGTMKAQQDNKADAVKTADTAPVQSDDAGKTDAAKPAAPEAAAPKPASNTIVLPVAGPPAAIQAQAPSITQHIQVTAQPHETQANLPALAVEIAAKSLSGTKQFDIRLDPPELGRVEVRLSIDATGKASAHLSADQPQTLTLLQKDAPTLARALRDAGLDVSQDGLNFSLRQQANQDGGASAQSGRGHGRGFSLSASSSIEATSTSAAYSRPADGRLDIRV
jgi:flagellar hook-length control protein FliK